MNIMDLYFGLMVLLGVFSFAGFIAFASMSSTSDFDIAWFGLLPLIAVLLCLFCFNAGMRSTEIDAVKYGHGQWISVVDSNGTGKIVFQFKDK